MEDSEDNMSAEDIKPDISLLGKPKPKKRSLVERELETSLTARVTSPITNAEASSTSRYGRARKLKTDNEATDFEKLIPKVEKSPSFEKTPVKVQSPVYRMHASNSPMRLESPKGTPSKIGSVEANLETQIESIYHENISLSRFGSEEKKVTPNKTPKVYVRKDLIQKREDEETIPLIKNLFSPAKSGKKSNSHINNIMERSSEKYGLETSQSKIQNGFTSVVKTLDFDSKKKRKDNRDAKTISKSELFEMEAKCEYQVGDLAWSRMGTYPFWPCIVTREPMSGMFVKKKLFGRIERDVIHVTFFGDNGRRGWIVDTMLRKFLGQLEFEATKEQFTVADKKKDPRLYAAFFISEKKMPQWNIAVEEAESLLREPKRLRIDILNDMLMRGRSLKTTPKHNKSGKITRTASDVSLSESLYDTLFSEDDVKGDCDSDRSRNKSRNKSLDVSEVVTACLDNMAAMTGNIKIQRQSHMDRWLQKAKSKTPEKSQGRLQVIPQNIERKETKVSAKKKKQSPRTDIPITQKPYSFRRSAIESQKGLLNDVDNENGTLEFAPSLNSTLNNIEIDSCDDIMNIEELQSGIGIIAKVESLSDSAETESLSNENEVCDKLLISEIHTEENKEMCSKKSEAENIDLQVDKDKENEGSNGIDTSKVLCNQVEEPMEMISSRETESYSVFQFPEHGNKTLINNDINTLDSNETDSASVAENKEVHTNNTENIVMEPTGDLNHKLQNDLVNGDVDDHNTNEISAEQDVINVDSSNNKESGGHELNIHNFLKPLSMGVSREYRDPEFVKYLEIRQDDIMDQYPELSQDEVINYLHKTWLYKEKSKSDTQKTEDLKQSTLVKGLNKSKAKSKTKQTRKNEQKKINEPVELNVDINEHENTLKVTENIDLPIKVIDNVNDAPNEIDVFVEPNTNKMLIDVQNISKNEIVTNLNVLSVDHEVEEIPSNEMNVKDMTENQGSKCNKLCEKLPSISSQSEMEILTEDMDISSCNYKERLHEEEDGKGTISELSVANPINSCNKPVEVGVNEKTEVEIITEQKDVNDDDAENIKECNLLLDDDTSCDSLDISYAISPLSDKVDEANDDLNEVQENSETKVESISNNELDKIPHVTPSSILGHIDSITQNGDITGTSKDFDMFDKNKINEAGPKETVSNKTEQMIETQTKNDSTVPDRDTVNSVEVSEVVKINGCLIPKCIEEVEGDNLSINSEDSEPLSVTKSKLKLKQKERTNKYADPEFVTYLEMRQDDLTDEHPELSQDQIVEYLYNTWLYEENSKSDIRKTDDVQQSTLIKGLGDTKPTIKKGKTRESKDKKKENNDIKENCDIETTSVKSEESVSIKRWLRPKRYTSKLYADFDSSRDSSPAITDETADTFSLNSLGSEEYRSNNSTPNYEIVKPNKTNKMNKLSLKLKPLVIKCNKVVTTDKTHTDSQNNSNDNVLTNLPDLSKPDMINRFKDTDVIENIKKEFDPENVSIKSDSSEVSLAKRKQKSKNDKNFDDPEFCKYLELRQDALVDENPQLTQDEIVSYLYKTWLYEESVKSDMQKTDEIEQSNLVKGIHQENVVPKRVRKKIKEENDLEEEIIKTKPKRKTVQPYYNEDYPDIEDELAIFEILKNSPTVELNKMDVSTLKSKENNEHKSKEIKEDQTVIELDDEIDEVELYFEDLTKPKPNIFKGLLREKVCEICEKVGNLVKCKSCNSMFHMDCVKNETEAVETKVSAPIRGRKKKKKKPGRKPKNLEDSGSMSDEKSQDVSAENMSVDEIIEPESHTVDAENFEAQLSAKMKELLESTEKEIHYDSYSSDDGIDWENAVAGKCEIVDVVLKPKSQGVADFKCNNCLKHETPLCFVCKSAASKTGVEYRQRCQVAHCHKYYHLECLDHWPQTQFTSSESRNKKTNEVFEAHMCPRHVCHTCVSDDPRGCKTRFSGDKLARCIRCPATYHSFTKCLPAGTQILTGSHIICPRHYQHRPGKVPCHVNTGWCFICALGGTLICCEYCPTSFHAECLNISPPEGNYMCEDCETGRLPLYGEMVWVKLGHYRWWPGIILHPSEIPENILAVKHSPGEFVVRFFGQYDHYWVNRGRVFPFQEGDSGKISSQKSKIDAAFTTAMEHAQRAWGILKNAQENDEESLDIASSLLPPHYVKLKVNKPCGSLVNKRVDMEESSLTQCDCDPSESDPCGPYSQCLNRMLLTECGPICRAGDRCNNRAFEKRLYPKLVPYRTPHRGWGLKTLEDIKAGQFVIEYVGELIDEEEFKRRMARKHEIRDENFYFLTLDKERMIDAGPKGNLARFMNHCCEPNCETQKWTVLGDVRVGLFAVHDIPANSEVTFNYLLECAGIDKKKCMCGAKRCAGYIGAKPKQEESQPKKGKVAAKRTYKKRKNTEESPSTKTKAKRPVGRPAKPKELTEIEKDLLIIKNATNGLSSDSECSRLSSLEGDRNMKALKRKRVSFSTDDVIFNGNSPSVKRTKLDEKSEID